MMEQATSILVIEDDPAVARSLIDGLSREGWQVVAKSTGADGVAYARDRQPHLIILDVRLPDGSGFDFCRQMRQSGLRQPIIILTVQDDEIDKILGLELGADDYMTKPFSLRELVSRVRAQLRRAYGDLSSTEGDILYAGDLIIDRGRGLVRRGQRELNLTPTEFRLLVHLARHTGQALTREQILEAVWGYDSELEDERTINVHIRRLREKIEPDPGSPTLILTVPGIGYRFTG
jgi:DNA-binding response OmpR family regulator